MKNCLDVNNSLYFTIIKTIHKVNLKDIVALELSILILVLLSSAIKKLYVVLLYC
jgi:hypothetical protein